MLFSVCCRWLVLMASLVLAPAHAARSWEGRVTYVTDGDTLWVQPLSGGAPLKLRLEGLDAPEICQPWGPESQRALSALLQGQPVRVHAKGQDAYGRRLSQIQFQGQDVGQWLVHQGHAWSIRFQGRAGRYAPEQQDAQKHSRGLFSQPEPRLTPRQFRQRHGACRLPQTGHSG
jgi:micrococcal nuclease